MSEPGTPAVTGHSTANSFFQPRFSQAGFPVDVTVRRKSTPFLYHWHDAVEILYGVSGTVSVGVGSRSYTLREGDIIIIGSQESHCVLPAKGSAHLVLDFEPSLAFSNSILSPYKNCYSMVENHSSSWPQDARRQIKSCLGAIYRENRERGEGWQVMLFSRLMEMTAAVIRELPRREPPKQGPSEAMIRRALEFLSAHYLEEVTIERCAKELGFNPSYLSHIFRGQLGISFHQYLVNLRLNMAEWYLEHTDMPVPQVSERSGFVSLKTFYRVFRKRTGMPPGAFRAREQRASK